MAELRCLCCGNIREKHSWLSGLCQDAKNFWTPNERIVPPDWAKGVAAPVKKANAPCPRCSGTGFTLDGRPCPWCDVVKDALKTRLVLGLAQKVLDDIAPPVAVQAKFVERIRPPLDWAKPTPFNHFPDLEGWVLSHHEVLPKA